MSAVPESWPGLVRLGFGRALPRWPVVLLLGLAAALALRSLAAAAATMDLELSSAARSAAARQSTWALGTCALVPLLAWFSAALGRHVVREAPWLAASRSSRAGMLAALHVGQWSCGLLLAAGIALLAECLAGAEPRVDALRYARELPGPVRALLPGDAPLRWSLADPSLRLAPGSVIAAELYSGLGGSAVQARLRGRRGSDGPDTEVSARVSSTARLRLALPPGDSELVFELSRGAGEALLVLPEHGLSLLVPSASTRLASLEIWLRCALLLSAVQALALGLGAWTSLPLAALLALTPWIPTYLGSLDWDWLPGGDLTQALVLVGDGLVPAACSTRQLLGCALALALGLSLARGGLARGALP